jgi:hypothetical protein
MWRKKVNSNLVEDQNGAGARTGTGAELEPEPKFFDKLEPEPHKNWLLNMLKTCISFFTFFKQASNRVTYMMQCTL